MESDRFDVSSTEDQRTHVYCAHLTNPNNDELTASFQWAPSVHHSRKPIISSLHLTQSTTEFHVHNSCSRTNPFFECNNILHFYGPPRWPHLQNEVKPLQTLEQWLPRPLTNSQTEETPSPTGTRERKHTSGLSDRGKNWSEMSENHKKKRLVHVWGREGRVQQRWERDERSRAE